MKGRMEVLHKDIQRLQIFFFFINGHVERIQNGNTDGTKK